ncbi:probable serine/threonine-protein kinase PBL7 [Hibiscus syriacus]|uniref:probable serine/threonine-protein kinase PBL7 n=1 Tax=Hibiscus syriacus TaxID=106335 RepID=UPI001923AC8C|nr:probable serine/threonine-protein kinase PBL7 [Hibiscus syriacus]
MLPFHRLQGFRFNLTPELHLDKSSAILRHVDQESESEEVEPPPFPPISTVASDDNHSDKAVLLNSISTIRRELSEPCLGWPLLRRKSPAIQEFKKHEGRDTSVVEWIMSLPDRVTLAVNQISLHSNQTSFNDNRKNEYGADDSVSSNAEPNPKPGWPLLRITASTTSIESQEDDYGVQIENSLPALRKMPNNLALRCKQFTLRELKQATSGFSPENLIGEGGCSNVYKGFLPGGKPVAAKIIKSYKEAWSDFSLEVYIVSSLKNKHITPLIGVCVENDYLISVYDFFPRGSLEEILHGQSRKYVLPWEVRYKIAIAIAEALNYLHNECSPPVIHRDVKSSNILLSDDFQPQLSDFGLAIRGTMDSTNMIDSNVVGTFGYIAPEYFMEGRVSNKIDVYSFGVVLLELLSGRRPVSSKDVDQQESLIQWANALLERRDLQGFVDPVLDGDFDVAQSHRMLLAATLCLNQLDIHRPEVSQILQVLQGNKEPTEGSDFHAAYMKVSKNQENDGLRKLQSYLSVPLSDDDSTSECKKHTGRCKTGKKRRLMLKEYLKREQ